jgi:hypothetical protein
MVQKIWPRLKFFKTRSKFKITRSKLLISKNGLFMGYLNVKYQNPIPYGSKDIAQVKVFQN